jgi:hypothetical protein
VVRTASPRGGGEGGGGGVVVLGECSALLLPMAVRGRK